MRFSFKQPIIRARSYWDSILTSNLYPSLYFYQFGKQKARKP